MEYKVLKSFYCMILKTSFMCDDIVKINNKDRAKELVDNGYLESQKKKVTKKKVTKDV